MFSEHKEGVNGADSDSDSVTGEEDLIWLSN